MYTGRGIYSYTLDNVWMVELLEERDLANGSGRNSLTLTAMTGGEGGGTFKWGGGGGGGGGGRNIQTY